MLFTVKKFISIFLMPMSLGLILLFLGLIFLLNKNYKRAKTFLIISFLWLALIGYSPFSNYLIQPLENQYKSYIKIDPNVKYVLVLGSGHVTNKEISNLSQLSTTALMRLNEGIRIYRNLENAKLILSGYEGSDSVPHALVAKKVAISLGVIPEDIITQEEAKDTAEEALYVKKTVEKNNFILVTSAFHMPRAMKIFKGAGLNPIAAPTDYLSKEDGDYLREPRGKEIRKTEIAMHEYIGTLWHDIIEKIRFYVN
ncbi:ElyC/SanA/YdcF family protein [Arcobacter sp. LA11]|uniref:ElyC/SanA/YdcF family protein n=1 Tax=Arcobacter sp. LA11 TaxID=1898176 RepID=UPI0009FA968D|nr:ElyC/SanA/YdcF family protein [Arcobacter sp. LA11]